MKTDFGKVLQGFRVDGSIFDDKRVFYFEFNCY